MSALLLIAAAPVAMVQSDVAITRTGIAQIPMAQASMSPPPIAKAPVALAPIVVSPIALGAIAQSPVVQLPVAQGPAAQAVVFQPQAKPEVAQLMPQVAFAEQALTEPSAGEFRIGAEGTALVQPQAAMGQPGKIAYRLAGDSASVQGPPAPDPQASDIAWANGQTAQHRAEVGRQGWHKIVPYEITWQLLNALDLAQTLDCTHRADCHEANPILGHRPSDGVVIGVKGGMAVLHYLLMRHIAYRNWKTARAAELGTILVQGVIDGLNFRYAFK